MTGMKVVTVRLPEALAAEIEAESRGRGVPKSVVVRERLRLRAPHRRTPGPPEAITDLVGSVEGLPPDLSAGKKEALRRTGYGRPRPR